MRPSASADNTARRGPRSSLPRLLFSLLLAVLLWAWVTIQRDPTQERIISSLPIAAPELPAPLQIAGELGSVIIRVAGPRSQVDAIARAELEPELDLSGITAPGDYQAPVVVPLPGAVRLIEIDPARLPIVVDETTSRNVTLTLQLEPPTDGTRQFGAVVPEFSEVTVSGPKRLVDQVATVGLPISMGERTADFSGQFEPVALSGDGQPIPEVDIRPRRIVVNVNVEARGRSVPVLSQTIGSPATGYETVDRAVNPSTVLLDGPEEVLADLVSVVTEPVNIEGATAPVSKRVGIADLPEGVRIVEPADGLVTVVVQVRQRGVTQSLTEQPVLVTGVGEGLTATTDPETVTVVIFAPEDLVSQLRAGDVVATVSAEGLAPGTYAIALSVAVPPGVQWILTEPESVTIVVTGIETADVGQATPSPSP